MQGAVWRGARFPASRTLLYFAFVIDAEDAARWLSRVHVDHRCGRLVFLRAAA